MKTCNKCLELLDKSNFKTYKTIAGMRHSANCNKCSGRKLDGRKKVEKELKIISPEFVRTSIVSTGNVHTVIATIMKGSKLFKYEEKFAIHRKAVLFIEQINEYPLLADQYLGKSKLIKNNSVYGRGEV